MTEIQSYIALKVDVDTDAGTRLGVPRLMEILESRHLPATFLFSLGPDNTGKAIRRIFRPGFLKKVTRTKVGKLYGWRTLLSGTLLPARHIGQRNAELLKAVDQAGFEVGIHCNDHFKWQDYLHTLDLNQTRLEFNRAVEEFIRIFGRFPKAAGAPGWQANKNSLTVYDETNFLYGSDTRGDKPFFPMVDGETFKTLQIPTTLPTLDELLGRSEYPESTLPKHYTQLLQPDLPNVWTIHAEIEGQSKSDLFERILDAIQDANIQFTTMENIATTALANPSSIPVCKMVNSTVSGRSGFLACQR